MPHAHKKQNTKQKQYCNKLIKDFKNGSPQKKIFKKEKENNLGFDKNT